MNIKKLFSIIELMTVILITLLLITLTIPAFENLKMNARTAICKSNFRQIGILLTSYQMDQNGFLPNDEWHSYNYQGTYFRGDIPNPAIGNNQFYQNWNGHLLPYMEVNLPDKYTRFAMVTKMGCTRFESSQLGGPPNPPPANVLKNGWAVVDDAYRVGGYHDLKIFICPEIHQNTYDIGVSITYNGIKIPKISQLCVGGFWAFKDWPTMDYGMGGGIPTTYVANNYFFGQGQNINSKRIDEIQNLSQKALLLEGGIADSFGGGGNGESGYVYYRLSVSGPDGGDLSSSRGALTPAWAPYQKMSYVHDQYDSFWILDNYAPSQWGLNSKEIADKFNIQFAGKACMVSGWNYVEAGYISYAIVSYIYPDDGKIFKDFFMANNPQAYPLPTFYAYVNEPNEFKYLTGNMNVLFGDGSVSTKDQAWLCNNREKIGAPSKE